MAASGLGCGCLVSAQAGSSSNTRTTTLRASFVGTSLPARQVQHLGNRRQQVSVQASAAVADAPVREFAKLGKDEWNTTYYPKGGDTSKVYKQWYVIDAEGQTLGRLATLAAEHIRGKYVPDYHPAMNMGAYVVIVNAEKVAVTGNKFNDKIYYRQGVNGRPGSMKAEAFKDLQKRIPERILERAVKGMLPKGRNRLGRELFHQLKVYKGPSHPHEAQQAVDITHKISKKPSEAVNGPSV